MPWNETTPRPRLFSLEDVCAMFGWDRSNYYKYVREGRFPRPRRIALKWTYTQADIDAYLLLCDRWQPGDFDADEKRGKKSDESEN